MKTYLLKLISEKELQTWKNFKSRCKQEGNDIKQAILQLIQKQHQEDYISERLERIEELLLFNSTGVYGFMTQQKDALTKQEKLILIDMFKGSMTLRELCDLADIKFVNQGYAKYSNRSLNAILHAMFTRREAIQK